MTVHLHPALHTKRHRATTLQTALLNCADHYDRADPPFAVSMRRHAAELGVQVMEIDRTVAALAREVPRIPPMPERSVVG